MKHFVFLLAFAAFTGSLLATDKSCCRAGAESGVAPDEVVEKSSDMKVPDILVTTQDGKQLKLYSDLIKDKTVAVSFIFTTCTTICPPIGANMAKLGKELGETDVQLISISVDPLTDTPGRLAAWKNKFGGGDNWTLVTGAKTEIDKALKAMQFFTADKTDHSPFILMGNEAEKKWQRVNGFTEPAKMASILKEMTGPAPVVEAAKSSAETTKTAAARKYFTDLELTDQKGEKHRLFTDLMKDKIIVMQSFFTTCTSVCPNTVGNFASIQEHLGDRLGRDVLLLSITVDPVNDTPQKLEKFAKQWKARDGWYFLTGSPERVQTALLKFGQMVDHRDSHSNVFIMGNLNTGLWKKSFGLAGDKEVIKVLDTVINDQAVALSDGGVTGE